MEEFQITKEQLDHIRQLQNPLYYVKSSGSLFTVFIKSFVIWDHQFYSDVEIINNTMQTFNNLSEALDYCKILKD
jgi:hypothetical protein